MQIICVCLQQKESYKMRVAILKYNSGNICSVRFALERLGIDAIITDNKEELRSADKIIFPGVGEASGAMTYLKAQGLEQMIPDLKQPVLGICLGMQLMCSYSEEGNVKCLNIFDTEVKRFKSDRSNKVPQIGWNTITALNDDLFLGLGEKEYMYFVHSYYAVLSKASIATTNYGMEYSSALRKNNFYGVQFHPEKSGRAGERIVENFVKL